MTSSSPPVIFPLAGKRVWVAGHNGMVGSAIVRRLQVENCSEILTANRKSLNLTRQSDVEAWMASHKPDAVFLAAAKVGGILDNSERPATFIYENLAIETNIIEASRQQQVAKLLFLGSSCVYPKYAEQPITEDALLTGPLEPTNEWYAVAKIAGIKLCQAYRRQYGCDYISAMPTNLYGPGDNYDTNSSHVLPALIRKAHEAREAGTDSLEIWGTGAPRREFLHVDDCADALVLLMKTYSDAGPVNVGSGEDITIEDVARLVMDVVGLRGELQKDLSKPDGTPRKLMSSAILKSMGWWPQIELRSGIASTYTDWLANGGSDQRRFHAPVQPTQP
jgi:GDP-L-fucose synthase